MFFNSHILIPIPIHFESHYCVSLLEIHQKEMLQKGILKSLIQLLDHTNPQLRSKALEVVQYFDSTFFRQFFSFSLSHYCSF